MSATFSVGGERRTLSSIIREKAEQFLLIPVIIRKDPETGQHYDFFNPPPLVQAIEKWGFDGVVIGTDEYLYEGNNSFISLGKQVTNRITFFRLDYYLDPVQIYETRAIGTDGIFVTHENLEEKQIEKVIELSLNLAMDTAIHNPSFDFLKKFKNLYDGPLQDLILVYDKKFLHSCGEKEANHISDFIRENNILSLCLTRDVVENELKEKFLFKGVVFFPGNVNNLEEYMEKAKKIKQLNA